MRKPRFPRHEPETRAHYGCGDGSGNLPFSLRPVCNSCLLASRHPAGARQIWEDSRQNFSAEWRIPPGTGFEELRVNFPRHQLVLAVASGAIRLSYGAREVQLVAGQAVAVSVPEVLVDVPFSPYGESVFVLHLIHRMPTMEELGEGGELAATLAQSGGEVPGLFPYRNASLLLQPGPYSAVLPRNGADLVHRLWLCGLEPTVRFLRSMVFGD